MDREKIYDGDAKRLVKDGWSALDCYRPFYNRPGKGTATVISLPFLPPTGGGFRWWWKRGILAPANVPVTFRSWSIKEAYGDKWETTVSLP